MGRLADMTETRSHFSTAWARSASARAIRETIICYILGPAIDFYTHTKVVSNGDLDNIDPPVLFASNHSSHLDTPVILKSLPPRWRSRTAVVAAADYFYKNRLLASVVSLSFATIPIERARLSRESSALITGLLKERWSLLFYPEGTRSRDGVMGRLRPGTGYLAVEHGLPVVPIALTGTYQAMPPGRFWARHHPVTIHFGAPVTPVPGEDHRAFTARLQATIDKLVHEARPP